MYIVNIYNIAFPTRTTLLHSHEHEFVLLHVLGEVHVRHVRGLEVARDLVPRHPVAGRRRLAHAGLGVASGRGLTA